MLENPQIFFVKMLENPQIFFTEMLENPQIFFICMPYTVSYSPLPKFMPAHPYAPPQKKMGGIRLAVQDKTIIFAAKWGDMPPAGSQKNGYGNIHQ